MRFLSHDADLTLGMLAFDAFPRFISWYCRGKYLPSYRILNSTCYQLIVCMFVTAACSLPVCPYPFLWMAVSMCVCAY